MADRVNLLTDVENHELPLTPFLVWLCHVTRFGTDLPPCLSGYATAVASASTSSCSTTPSGT